MPLQTRGDDRQRVLAADRGHELRRAAAFVDERVGARERRRNHHREATVRGVQHDPRLRVPRPHGQALAQVVEDDDVGVGPVQQRPERAAIGGDTDSNDSGVLVEDRVHARAGRGVVIADDDADHAATASRAGRATRGRHAIRKPTPVTARPAATSNT